MILFSETYEFDKPSRVRSIAHQYGYQMPSFFGFAARAILTMLPIYVALAIYFAITGA